VAHRAARIVGRGDTLDRRRARFQFSASGQEQDSNPAIAAPPGHAGQDGSSDAALIEILRGRLEGLGPVTVEALAAPLGIENVPSARPLAALEAEGFAMRGHFTPMAIAEEWCDRRLLARIHHYMVKRLRRRDRARLRPRFPALSARLAAVDTEYAYGRPDALKTIVEQLEGFERQPGLGRPRFYRRASKTTTRLGSTITAWPGASLGRGCGQSANG